MLCWLLNPTSAQFYIHTRFGGSKREAESYRTISQQFDCAPGQILFISDVVEELAAAKEAGLQTALSLRPGNKPVPEKHGFLAIESFAELCVG